MSKPRQSSSPYLFYYWYSDIWSLSYYVYSVLYPVSSCGDQHQTKKRALELNLCFLCGLWDWIEQLRTDRLGYRLERKWALDLTCSPLRSRAHPIFGPTPLHFPLKCSALVVIAAMHDVNSGRCQLEVEEWVSTGTICPGNSNHVLFAKSEYPQTSSGYRVLSSVKIRMVDLYRNLN